MDCHTLSLHPGVFITGQLKHKQLSEILGLRGWNLNNSKLLAGISDGFLDAIGTSSQIHKILNLFEKEAIKKKAKVLCCE